MYRYIVWAFFVSAPIFMASALQSDPTLEDSRDGDNWKCRDGSYISMAARCDGVFNCKDHSDESHALCWKLYCPPSRFRCAYGACVDRTAPCNGIEECADGSDEVLPRCRNFEKPIHNGQFTCYGGEMIQAGGLCDGKKDCVDGSDESLAYCAGRRCAPNQFQCKYGACVDPHSNCDANHNQDCADGSDESDELCKRNTTTFPFDTSDNEVIRLCDGFRCNDGTCLLKEHRCDGIPECFLGEDEHGCEDSENLNAKCSDDQWTCRDGSCIAKYAQCDGKHDCPDFSDETHALCRKHDCPPSRFRCTYGACVSSTAPCDSAQDCVDNSDELLPMCRNETLVVNAKFTCENGKKIPAEDLCDGIKDCADGSDETLASCAAQRCTSRQFQCAYGACVDPHSECEENRKEDCADGSDETNELCGRITEPTVLPPNQEQGTYAVALPHSTQFCELPRHYSVTYYCGDRECDELVPSGTEVRPICKNLYSFHGQEPVNMACVSNTWNYIATCQLKFGANSIVNTNNLTLFIGDNITVHLSGAEYTVTLKDGNETIFTKSVPEKKEWSGPNEKVSDDTVVVVDPNASKPELKQPV